MSTHIKESLSAFRKEFEPVLRKVIDEQLTGYDSSSFNVFVDHLKKYSLSEGKRLRPFLFAQSVRGLTNRPFDTLYISCFVELIHLELLALDDIMDKSDTRHGVATIHTFQDSVCKKSTGVDDCEHFGVSTGILAGVMLGNVAMRVLAKAQVPKKEALRAVDYYNGIVIDTAFGQYLDVYAALKKRATLDEIKDIHYYKTARYTLEAPLVAGAFLSGFTEEEVVPIERFAKPLGHAFQIIDDLLGIFGKETALGKSASSDLEEGKQTYLTAFALSMCGERTKEELLTLLKKSVATYEDHERFKEILVDSGSYEFSVAESKKLLREALNNLENTPYDQEAKTMLEKLACYIVERKN